MKKLKSKSVPAPDFECVGSGRKRHARKLPKGSPNVCYRIRDAEPDPWGKRHAAEIFSGKTGESLGFIGPACTVVLDTAKAKTFDQLNNFQTKDLLRQCLGMGYQDKERVKAFKGEVKKALKALPNGPKGKSGK